MESSIHRFSELFAQLGLPSDVHAIAQFIEQHAPIPAGQRLEEAPCWTTAQASLPRDMIAQDADWAELADQLNSALHRR